MENKETDKQVAKYLLDIKAVELQPNLPFTWASGWKSPIYTDNRKTLSYPEVRNFIKKSFVDIIKNKYDLKDNLYLLVLYNALLSNSILPLVFWGSSAKIPVFSLITRKLKEQFDIGVTRMHRNFKKNDQKVLVCLNIFSIFPNNFAVFYSSNRMV